MKLDDLHKLTKIQALLDTAYQHYAAHTNGACKSLEGQVTLTLGTTFDHLDGAPDIQEVKVYSYLFGEGERHHFFGTLDEALAVVQKWHDKEMATEYDAQGCVIDKV